MTAVAELPVVLVSGASLGTTPFRRHLQEYRGQIYFLGETDGSETTNDPIDHREVLADRLVVESGEAAGERLAAALLESATWRQLLGRLLSEGRAEVFMGGTTEFCDRLRQAMSACVPEDFWPSQDVWQPEEMSDEEENEGFDEVILEETYRFDSETQLEPGGHSQFRCASQLSSTAADLPDFNFELIGDGVTPDIYSPSSRTTSLLSLDTGDWWRRRLPSSVGFDSGLNSPAESDLHHDAVEPVVTREIRQSTYCGPDKTTFSLEETVRLTIRRTKRAGSNTSLPPPSPYWSCRGSRNFLNSTTSLDSPSRSRRESETSTSLYCPLSPSTLRISPRRQLWPFGHRWTSSDSSWTS